MYFRWAFLAAFGVAILNGIAAVLEKITADKQKRARKLRVNYWLRMFTDWPYIVGFILDVGAWILTLIAVHVLPLFVVQPIIALGVVVTVIAEFFWMRRKISASMLVSIALIFIGIALIALTATPQTAIAARGAFEWIILFLPALLALIGSLITPYDNRIANIMLGALSGISFGGTAITGRMLNLSLPYWRLLYSPIFWSLAAYGVVGILLFTVALQRHNASIVNAASVMFDTIFPLLIGVFFLGDRPRNGDWLAVAVGVSLAVIGAISISLSEEPIASSYNK